MAILTRAAVHVGTVPIAHGRVDTHIPQLPLIARDVIETSGKEVTMGTVEYFPGAHFVLMRSLEAFLRQ